MLALSSWRTREARCWLELQVLEIELITMEKNSNSVWLINVLIDSRDQQWGKRTATAASFDLSMIPVVSFPFFSVSQVKTVSESDWRIGMDVRLFGKDTYDWFIHNQRTRESSLDLRVFGHGNGMKRLYRQ